MKNNGLILYGLILFNQCTFAQSEVKLPTIEELCKYAPQYCSAAATPASKISNGQINYYKKMTSIVLRISKQYEVDPVTLVMAPITENTLNVSGDDDIQDFLVKSKILSEARLFGKDFTVGPGQIQIPAALQVEEIVAKKDNRPLYPEKTLIDSTDIFGNLIKIEQTKAERVAAELMDPTGALKYAAALLKHAETVYLKHQINISKRPDLLATLYNIGKNEESYQRSAKENRLPRPNYFGYFASKNYDYIREVLNLPSVFDNDFSFATMPLNVKNSNNRQATWIDAITVYQFPPICNGTTNKPLSGKTKILHNEYEQVSELAYDCQKNSYVMITDFSSQSGWVAISELKKSSKNVTLSGVSPFQEKNCEKIVHNSCTSALGSLKQKYGFYATGKNVNNEIHLVMGTYIDPNKKILRDEFNNSMASFKVNCQPSVTCDRCANYFTTEYFNKGFSMSDRLKLDFLNSSKKTPMNQCFPFFDALRLDVQDALLGSITKQSLYAMKPIMNSVFINELAQNECVNAVELPLQQNLNAINLDTLPEKMTLTNSKNIAISLKNSCQ